MIAYSQYTRDSRVRREAEALADAGYNVDFITLREQRYKTNQRINRVNIFRLPLYQYRGSNLLSYLLSYFLFFTLTFFKLSYLQFQKIYKIIHVNNMPNFLVFAAIIPKLCGAKIILDNHDIQYILFNEKLSHSKFKCFLPFVLLEQYLTIAFSDKLFCADELQKRQLAKYNAKYNTVGVILNIPDESIFMPQSSKYFDNTQPESNIDEKIFKIVYHGTIAKRFGLDNAVKAINRLKRGFPNIKLFIYGEGDGLQELKNLRTNLKLHKHVYLSERYLPLPDVYQEIKDADLGLVPNNLDRATNLMLPVKLLEYMTIGIPTITVHLKTITYYFNSDVVYYMANNSPEQISAAILDLYRHPEKREQLALKSINFHKKYSWKTHKYDYINPVEKLINS